MRLLLYLPFYALHLPICSSLLLHCYDETLSKSNSERKVCILSCSLVYHLGKLRTQEKLRQTPLGDAVYWFALPFHTESGTLYNPGTFCPIGATHTVGLVLSHLLSVYIKVHKHVQRSKSHGTSQT